MRHVARKGDKVVGEAVGGHPVVNPFILVFVGANTARERHGIQKGQILATLSPSALLTAEPNAAISAHFDDRSEEHTSELQSLMRTSYAVFCLKKKTMMHALS